MCTSVCLYVFVYVYEKESLCESALNRVHEAVFKMVASVLHVGNVSFADEGQVCTRLYVVTWKLVP